jgi:hypothetical protein
MSDMRSYILFDLSFIPVGSTLNSMVVTFTVSRVDPSNTQHTQEHTPQGAQLQQPDTQPKPPATVNDSGVGIDACPDNVGFGNTEGGPPSVRDPQNPTAPLTPVEPDAQPGGVDTTSCVHGVGSATTWTFDITPIAQKWVSGATFNNGIALLPVLTPAANWTVELHGAYYASAITDPNAPGGTAQQIFVNANEQAMAKVDYIPAAVVPPVTPPLPAVVPPVTSIAPPPSSVVTLPSAPLPTPVPTAQAIQPTPVSRSSPKTPWYVWLLLPVGLAGFLILSSALGREAGEQTVNRVAEVLRRRHGETAGA